MKHGSLFNGIGGFQLAAEWMGWENVFSCEIDKFCNKVTKYHFPNCIQHEDIRTTDFSIYRRAIDIITGGFPCQPYSVAGKRKGKADERHLWPEMLRAIREIQPSWVVGENVPGLLNWKRGMVLHEIKTNLEAEGFEVFPPLVLPACGKDAPHRRERLWIIAHARRCGFAGWKEFKEGQQYDGGGNARSEPASFGGVQFITNSEGDRDRRGLWSMEEKNGCKREPQERGQDNSKPGDVGEEWNVANSNSPGLQERQVNGCLAKNKNGGNKREAIAFHSWGFTQPSVCGRDDGIPNRVDRIKALGNAIVPQVAYEIFKAIELVETNEASQGTVKKEQTGD